MMKLLKKASVYGMSLLVLLFVFLMWGCVPQEEAKTSVSSETAVVGKETDVKEILHDTLSEEESTAEETEIQVLEDGEYNTAEEVALYLHRYAKLPDNFITKKEAEKLGWDSKEGNLWEVAPGKSIGGSHYGNYEKQLPEAKGRKYFECDVNYDGGYRGSERIIYSNDGLIYYTGDHYKTFTLLYE